MDDLLAPANLVGHPAQFSSHAMPPKGGGHSFGFRISDFFRASDFGFRIWNHSIASPLLQYCLLLAIPLLLAGCAGSKPPPPPQPVAIAQVQHTAEQAAKLSDAGNWLAAAHEWQLATDRFHLLNDRTNYAIALHNLAQARRQLGELTNAHSLLAQAAGENRQLGRQADWWRNQIALLQLEAQMRHTNALQNRFGELLPLAPGIPSRDVSALFLNELGLWRQSQGELPQAADSFRQAREQFAALGDEAGLATVEANQAGLLETQQDYPAAVERWRAALARFEALGEPPEIARGLLGLGRTLLRARQDLPRAEDLLRRAARNFELLQAPAGRKTALRLLVDCLVAQDKKREAEAVREEIAALAPDQAN